MKPALSFSRIFFLSTGETLEFVYWLENIDTCGGLVCVYVWPPGLYFGDIYY